MPLQKRASYRVDFRVLLIQDVQAVRSLEKAVADEVGVEKYVSLSEVALDAALAQGMSVGCFVENQL